MGEYPDRTICTDLRISIAGSPAGENGRALLDKRLGCLPVVFGAVGLHLVRGLHIEQASQGAAAATWYHGSPRPLWVNLCPRRYLRWVPHLNALRTGEVMRRCPFMSTRPG